VRPLVTAVRREDPRSSPTRRTVVGTGFEVEVPPAKRQDFRLARKLTVEASREGTRRMSIVQ
jgi:hypothetical protein